MCTECERRCEEEMASAGEAVVQEGNPDPAEVMVMSRAGNQYHFLL